MSHRTKIVLLAAAIALAYFAVGWFESDESRIRRAIDDGVAGFNDGDVGDTIAPLAETFREERHGADRRLVQRFLAALFLRKQNTVDGRFRYPATIDESSVTIEIRAGEPKSASASATVSVRDLRNPEAGSAWVVRVSAEFEEIGGDWQITRARFETTSGQRPF